MPNPPVVAQALLRLLLPAEARETVSGDLLEEYRAARIAAIGRFRANLWYWRQVGNIWMRSYKWFAIAVVFLFTVHDLFNTFRTVSGTSYLSQPAIVLLSPLWAVGVFVLAGAYGTWRTQRWAGGFVATLGMFLVVWLFVATWWSATLYPFAQVQQSNPYWIQAWQWSTHRPHPSSLFGFTPDAPDASFVRWMFWDNLGGLFFLGLSMVTLSVGCAGVGGLLGLITARWRPVSNRGSS